MKKCLKNNRPGFSMMESLMGIVVLVFISFGASGFLMNFTKANVAIKEISQATTLGNAAMEKLRMVSYGVLTNGTDTIDNKYLRNWAVNTQAGMKVINMTVQWPIAPKAGQKSHAIQLSTIRAQ